MPEVVYPSGRNRTWADVFPILRPEHPDDSEWRCINDILYTIAMNNRFGGMTVDDLRAELHKRNKEMLTSELEKVEASDKGSEYILKERKEWIYAFGAREFYIDEVFDNLGGAYRERK